MPTESNSGKGAIHIVDDEEDIVRLVTTLLEDNGYTVHSFTDANEALEDIELRCKNNVRMLITDIRMPDHTGIEITRRARAIMPDLPVIFMTGFEVHSSEFGKVFPRLEGPNSFIQKPVNINQLLEAVKGFAEA